MCFKESFAVVIVVACLSCTSAMTTRQEIIVQLLKELFMSFDESPSISCNNDVIIVTDIAIGLKTTNGKWGDVDDAFAIRHILNSHLQQKVNVVAIVAQFGNAMNVTNMYDKLNTLIEILNLQNKPQLFKGSSQPYQPGIISHDPDIIKLVELIRNHQCPLNIIGIGPATSIAYVMDVLAQGQNNLLSKIKQIYLEMGQYGPEWGQSCGFTICGKMVGDFNFKSDVAAVQRLIQLCPSKLYFTPFQIIKNLKFNAWDLLKYLFLGNEVERWLASGSIGWFRQWTGVFNCEEYIHLWDTVPLIVGSGIVPDNCKFIKVIPHVEDCRHKNVINMTKRLVLTEAKNMQIGYSWVCPQYTLQPAKL